MQPFTVLEGIAAPLRIINIDTDMIIPKQYLKNHQAHRPRLRPVLGNALSGRMAARTPDFGALNKPAYRKAEILVAGDNFGCGSSRSMPPGRCSIRASAA